MRQDVFKILTVGAASLLAFAWLKPEIKEEQPIIQPSKYPEPVASETDLQAHPNAKQAFDALSAYIAAYNQGETKTFLKELNREIKKMYNVQIQVQKDGSLEAQDLKGNTILIIS